MNSTRKYLADITLPHIGSYITSLMGKTHMTQSEVARKLGVKSSVVSQYREQVSVQFGILWTLSKAFNHNILAEMGEKLNVPYETQTEKALKKELKTLKQELDILRRIVGTK